MHRSEGLADDTVVPGCILDRFHLDSVYSDGIVVLSCGNIPT